MLTGPDALRLLPRERSFLVVQLCARLAPFGLPSCDKYFEIQRQRPMTNAIIFDLDSCLAAADEVGEQLFAPAFAAISDFKL